jgi:hypothetical protein
VDAPPYICWSAFVLPGVKWALDSGAFKEIEHFGEWTWTPRRYALWVRTVEHQVGGLEWAACMDWMCEEHMLKRTGLSVQEHQRRTVANYLELRSLAPGVKWVPALQGWEPEDYLRCAEMYERAGVDLASLPLVGLGSVCRRQHTPQIIAVVEALAGLGLRLHGFGVKTRGLQILKSGSFATADSLAWSFGARVRWHNHGWKMEGCTHSGGCANCARYALHWRSRLLSSLSVPAVA